MTKPEKDYMNSVAALGCAICRINGLDTPAEIHHARTGTGLRRASHFDTIPLCFIHHRGAEGLHTLGRKRWEKFHSVIELDILAETKKMLA